MGAVPCLAVNRYVAFGGSDTAPYTNWTTAASNIQAAVDACSAGDTVWVSNGVYVSTGPVTNGAMVSITNAITLKSVNGAAATVIAGGYPAITNRCLYLSHASAVVQGFTFRDGFATGASPLDKGGGVYISANGTLRSSLIVSNTAAGDGGGVYVATNGTVENCTLSTNTAVGNGGGVFVATAATLRNNILYFNAAAGSVNYSGGTHTYSCATPLPGGTGNTASDPVFANVAAGDFHLLTNSPCINVASYVAWMESAVDLDGQPRVMGGQGDMGVDEFTRFFYVSEAGDNTNPGTQANPWRTIPYAITNSLTRNGDTIVIGEGTYTNPIVFNASARTGLNLVGGYNTNDWTWAPAAHPTLIKPATNTIDAITVSVQPLSLRSLTITGGRYGIYANAGNNNRMHVLQCIVSNNATDGIRLQGSKQAILAINDLIVRNGGDGIAFYTDNNPYSSPIYNCTIAHNGGRGVYDNYLTTGLDLRNSIVRGNAQYGIYQGNSGHGTGFTVGYSSISGNTNGSVFGFIANVNITLQAGTVFADPLFVGGDDWRLQNGSPCVDYGANLTGSGVTEDLEGNPRTPPLDMGCYESVYDAAPRYAATYVDAAQPDDTGDGSSWGTAKKTVGSGLAVTEPGGTCTVGSGTYPENVYMPANTTLAGTNRNTTTMAATWFVVSQVDTNTLVSGLTLTGGFRGVNVTGDRSTVRDCVLINNSYGLAQTTQRTYVDNCVVTNNSVNGLHVFFGGASGMGLTARNCLIARNGAEGMYVERDNGGGNQFYVMNCSLVSNGSHGYRFYGYSCPTYITNTIISANGGYATFYTNCWGTPRQYLDYGDVYGNAGGTHYNNTTTPQIGANMLASDPKLAADFRLTSLSPCIDAGRDLTSAGITNDLDGVARTNTFDIGCYESAFPPPPKYDFTYADASMADDDGDGTNWLSAKKTIGAALSILTPTGTCYVASGVYNEGVSIPANTTVAGTNRLTTVVSNSGSVVTMGATNSTLREMTAAGGTRGITLSGVGNLVQGCIFQNNTESGVYIIATSNRVTDCTLRNNQYGVYAGVNQNVVYFIDRCVIQSNTSHGIYQPWNGCGQILNTLITHNGGDGFSSWTDNASFSTYLYNCTIAFNTGNGIYDNYLTRIPYVRNCIIIGNGGRGILQNNNGHHDFYVANSCVFSNVAGNIYHYQANGKIAIQGGNISAEPFFVGSGDFHLEAASPCIGGGMDLTGSGVTNDLDGNPRVAPFDMGCYQSGDAPAAKFMATYADASRPDDAGAGTNAATAKRTIGSALAMTDTNGTCYVAAGSYNDTVILPRLVTLSGAGAETTIVTSRWYVAALPETNSTVRGLTLQGGIYGAWSAANGNTIDQCRVYSNAVGVYVTVPTYSGSRFTMTRSTVISNTTFGIYSSQGVLSLLNCLIVKNGSDGIQQHSDNAGKNTFFDYCTIVDNAGDGYEHTHNLQYPVLVTNCLITGNTGYGYKRTATANYQHYLAYSFVSSNTTGQFSGPNINFGAGMVTNLPPQFFKSTYTLAEDSPCLDSGIHIGVTNDIRGILRPILARKPPAGSGYDMGCYETVPPVLGAVFVIH